MLDDIRAEARRQLARDGAAGLSLRSVARELGMVSSGIYRYVESRDALLTLLIVAGYDRLGATLEAAPDPDDPPRRRWLATCRALRSWATANPHEYALLYGSPVPGYAAPQDTVDPATRVYAALAAPLRDGPAPATTAPVPDTLAADGARISELLELGVAPEVGIRLLSAYATLFGAVSLELFGHTHNVVTDHDALFTQQVGTLADALGL